MNIGNQADSQHKPNTVEEIIDEILKKSSCGDFIYRGESKCYEKVSSGLYRAYTAPPGHGMEIRAKDIPGAIQESVGKILSDAKAYLDEPDDSEILTQLQLQRGTVDPDVVLVPGLETILARAQASLGKSTDFKILASLQHYGLATNLIDFTQDYLVALFFASHKDLYENGRVIVLENNNKSTEDFNIKEAPLMIDRAVFQRSVFVEASEGFINIDPCCIVHICHTLKKPLQDYLEKHHGLSTKGIYNDIHGFIRSYDIYPDLYGKLRTGQICYDEAFNAADMKEPSRGYKKAVGIFTEILGIDSGFLEAYLNRGRVHFLLGEYYDKQNDASEEDTVDSHGFYHEAVKDCTEAINQDCDYGEAYATRGKAYNSMREFQRALEDFDRAISLRVKDREVDADRCVSLMQLRKWEKLKESLAELKKRAQKEETDPSLNINAWLKSLEEHAEREGLELPEDIKAMLIS